MTAAPRPNVTIFADASYDRKTGAAGWGAWIKSDGRESITHGAVMKAKIQDNIQAEMAAIANALAVTKAQGWLCGAVMVQSDCLPALCAIRKVVTSAIDSPSKNGQTIAQQRKKVPPHLRKISTSILHMVEGMNIVLILRHVPGHRSGSGRQWVNRACDRIARQHMRDARLAIRQREVKPA